MKMEAPISQPKYDICFHNSLNKIKSNIKFKISLHLIQFVAMVVMIPLDLLVFNKETNQDEVLSFFIAATCATLLNAIARISHYWGKLCNDSFCFAIATDLNHIVQDEPQSERLSEHDNDRRLVSSTVYNVQTNISAVEATTAIQDSTQPAMVNVIQVIAQSKDPLTRCIIKVGSGASFALFIYGIVIMSTTPLEKGEVAVMVVFLISEFLIQIKIFLCLIFIALVPVLCVFCCLFVCCCGQRQKQAKMPEIVRADMQIIQKLEGSSCSICFQSINLEEEVRVLPCSDKHIFHDKCITAWTVVKPTCPICRFDLSA